MGRGTWLEGSPELKALRRVERVLLKLVEERFKADPGLKEYVKKRVEGAAAILRRPHLLLSIRRIAGNAWLAAFLSSRAPRIVGARRILQRTLEGRVVEEVRGTEIEDLIHYVEVSPRVMKCTCEDSIITAAAASRSGGLEARRILCKHVLALLSILEARGEIDVGSPAWESALLDALEAAKHRVSRKGWSLRATPLL